MAHPARDGEPLQSRRPLPPHRDQRSPRPSRSARWQTAIGAPLPTPPARRRVHNHAYGKGLPLRASHSITSSARSGIVALIASLDNVAARRGSSGGEQGQHGGGDVQGDEAGEKNGRGGQQRRLG